MCQQRSYLLQTHIRIRRIVIETQTKRMIPKAKLKDLILNLAEIVVCT